MSSKPRILVIPELFPTGGDPLRGIFLLDYIKAMAPYAAQHVMIPRLYPSGSHTDAVKGFASAEEVAAYSKDAMHWPRWIGYSRLLKKFTAHALEKAPFDLIHAHGSVIPGTLAHQLAGHWNCPVVITEHTGPLRDLLKRPFVGKMAQRAMRKARLVLAVSRFQQKEIINGGVAKKNVEVVYNPVNTGLFKPSNNELPRKQFLFCGRLDENKGALRTVKAFHKIAEKLDGTRLLICGEGAEAPSLRRYLLSHGLQDLVILKDSLSREDFLFELHGSCAFIFPSVEETFGLTGAEAISSGVPVVITNAGGTHDYFFKESGKQVNPLNIDEIADAMLSLSHQEPPDRKKMHRQIEENFGYRAFAKRMMECYGRLLTNKAE